MVNHARDQHERLKPDYSQIEIAKAKEQRVFRRIDRLETLQIYRSEVELR